MAAEKIHDEARLRSETRALAKRLYEKRWGKFTDADVQTLDVERWQDAWKVGADVEKRAQRHFAAIRKALNDAFAFLATCRGMPQEPPDRPPPGGEWVVKRGLPMGEAAQTLEACVPALLQTLEVIEQKRAERLTINPAERPERVTWMRRRAFLFYDQDWTKLEAAPRSELGVLAIMGGWWPKGAPKGATLRTRGTTVEHVLAAEADLMDRARTRLVKHRRDVEEAPAPPAFMQALHALILEHRKPEPRRAGNQERPNGAMLLPSEAAMSTTTEARLADRETVLEYLKAQSPQCVAEEVTHDNWAELSTTRYPSAAIGHVVWTIQNAHEGRIYGSLWSSRLELAAHEPPLQLPLRVTITYVAGGSEQTLLRGDAVVDAEGAVRMRVEGRAQLVSIVDAP